jgi:hypothetical protein
MMAQGFVGVGCEFVEFSTISTRFDYDFDFA